MRRIIAAAFFATASLVAQANPPRLLQIVRESIKPGSEAAYEAIESDTAVACATLKCPHPHLALEPSVGPREVWWFNLFESELQRRQVSSAYQRNLRLMEILARNGREKSKYTGEITDSILTYRPDLGRGAQWNLSGARLIVVTRVKGVIDTEGPVFEAPDGTYLVVHPVRNAVGAERLAKDPRAIVLAIRASWGMPAAEWIDADPDFWSANPVVSRPERTER